MDLTRCLPSDDAEPRTGVRRRYNVGNVIASKYRLEALLGEGGMGSVWRAFNIQLEAPVAIKVIRGDVDPELSERLRQEARAAAKLGHPAIVRIFDVGESEFGDPFIVMELLSGQSLGTLLRAEHRAPPARAVQLLLPVVDALSVAHAKGIIHRDLKPDNVFISLDHGQMQPKLVDFGIVKLSHPNRDWKRITQSGTVVGSPEYMSPEQARGSEDLDYRTDVWSLCVVLYEAVAGRVPFKHDNYNALLQGILSDDVPSLADELAESAGLWRIIQRGLAKDPNDRYQGMTELGQALAGWLVSQRVLEDACGTSLDAKWLNRTSGSQSRRRVAAPTSPAWLTRPRALLAGAMLVALCAWAIVAYRSNPSLLAARAEARAPTLATERSAVVPPVASLREPSPALTPTVALEAIARAPTAAKALDAAAHGAPHKRAVVAVAQPPILPAPAPTKPPPGAPNRAARDLLSPY